MLTLHAAWSVDGKHRAEYLGPFDRRFPVVITWFKGASKRRAGSFCHPKKPARLQTW
jgi:hypothetical protein